MNKRKELYGVLARILIYVIVMSRIETVCSNQPSNIALQIWRLIPAAVILVALLWGIARAKDFERLGFLQQTPFPWRKTLFLIPMMIVATANLWNGAVMRYAPLDTVWYIIAMLCIGFIEEILFRGYLLQLLLKRSIKVAVIVSSLTFGIGHIVNLANGADLLSTFLQLIYALAIGVMLSVFVVKTERIIPCCIFHGVFNALAAFSNESGQTIVYQVIVCTMISLISVCYAGFLWEKIDRN